MKATQAINRSTPMDLLMMQQPFNPDRKHEQMYSREQIEAWLVSIGKTRSGQRPSTINK